MNKNMKSFLMGVATVVAGVWAYFKLATYIKL